MAQLSTRNKAIIAITAFIVICALGYHPRSNTLDSGSGGDRVPMWSAEDRVATAPPDFYIATTDQFSIEHAGITATRVKVTSGAQKDREGWVPPTWVH